MQEWQDKIVEKWGAGTEEYDKVQRWKVEKFKQEEGEKLEKASF